MSDRPTPEVDSLWQRHCSESFHDGLEVWNLARSLERERDEAREKREKAEALLREAFGFVASDYEGRSGDLTGTNLIARIRAHLEESDGKR